MKALLEQFKDNNFLVSTDQWFFAPDGKMYRAAWGKVQVFSDSDTLGIKTNIRSTNWYAVIGKIGKGRSIVIAGCQIKYACVSMDKPVVTDITETRISDTKGEAFTVTRENSIYLAQD